jgi:hypothetical protein
VQRILPAVLCLLVSALVTGCSVEVHLPTAAVEDRTTTSSAPRSGGGELPGGAQPRCLATDDCAESSAPPVPVGLVCEPLPAAMSGFDQRMRTSFPGGQPATEDAAIGGLQPVVLDVVDRCGYQVMVDIAQQYPNPLYGWLRAMAYFALGEISALPEGLRCAELKEIGLGPKQAVDYWFLWGAPALMDADVNGIPCETVWQDVSRYMPSYY